MFWMAARASRYSIHRGVLSFSSAWISCPPQYTGSFGHCWPERLCLHACIHSVILVHYHVLAQPKHTVVTHRHPPVRVLCSDFLGIEIFLSERRKEAQETQQGNSFTNPRELKCNRVTRSLPRAKQWTRVRKGGSCAWGGFSIQNR